MSSPSGPSVKKLVIFGGGVFASHRLPRTGTLVIGRSESSDVRVEHESISRRHAQLHVGDTFALEDLGSVNGTRLRGERLVPGERVEVLDGETFQLGSATGIIARSQEASGQSAKAELGNPDQIETRRELSSRQSSPRPSPVGGGARLADRPQAVPRSAASPVHVIEARAMRELYSMLERIALGSINVLVMGETGVGKELVAETLHRRSKRREGPFLCLNCASLSEPLLEAELFGHERGAFTGAVQSKVGLLEAAHQGTLFLDEVGEMPLALQVKLLRAIEAQQVLRVGAVRPREIDVRFVAATNRDLEAAVRAGSFRQDLYFRLNGAKVVVPPLRQRIEEIEPLARAFAQRSARDLGRSSPPEPSPEVRSMLLAYAWPGNVRELRNFIERAVLLCDGPELLPAHFPLAEMADAAPLSTPAGAGASGEAAFARTAGPDSERERILRVLSDCGGNQSRAAKALGMARSTLVLRLDEYGVPRPRKS
jgi:two-component system, NtrC family, response regulator AtoC